MDQGPWAPGPKGCIEGAGNSSLGTPGTEGTQLGRMVAPLQAELQTLLCKKLGKSRDPLPRKMHICTHMHYLGDNFRRFLGPLESMNSQGVSGWFALGGGPLRVLVLPVFCPRSHCLSQGVGEGEPGE